MPLDCAEDACYTMQLDSSRPDAMMLCFFTRDDKTTAVFSESEALAPTAPLMQRVGRDQNGGSGL